MANSLGRMSLKRECEFRASGHLWGLGVKAQEKQGKWPLAQRSLPLGKGLLSSPFRGPPTPFLQPLGSRQIGRQAGRPEWKLARTRVGAGGISTPPFVLTIACRSEAGGGLSGGWLDLVGSRGSLWVQPGGVVSKLLPEPGQGTSSGRCVGRALAREPGDRAIGLALGCLSPPVLLRCQ